jgi:hypothetical protein
MSNFQNPVSVVPVAPRRRRRAVVISENLPWLTDLTSGVTRDQKLAPKLRESFCAEIESCNCCVCMEDIGRADVRRFGCGHDTCNSCFTQIYRISPQCPLCRRQITSVMSAPL